MDPRIKTQRTGSIMILVFFVLLIGITTGVLLATGLDWIPFSQAREVEAVEITPSDVLVSTQESLREMVTVVRPAVVSIQAEGIAQSDGYHQGDPFEMFGIPKQFDPFNHGNPAPNQQDFQMPSISSGSGFIVDPEGYILTNNHVVAGATDITVRLDDGLEFEAALIGSDPETDVAVLKIESDDEFPYISLGDSEAIQVGDWVMAVGNPFGNLAGTVTVGIVSATNREYLQLPGDTYYQNFIQTDAAINLGNSGGPLVDIYGHAVGINTAISSEGSGIGFATPINLVKFVYDSFRENGQVVRGWIGVTIQNLDPDLAKAMGMVEPHGSLVAEVHPGNPAALGGLQEGDIILEINGTKILSTQTASRIIASLPVGEPGHFKIFRDGKEMNLEITPIIRNLDASGTPSGSSTPDDKNGKEQNTAPSKSSDFLGIEVGPIDAQIREQLELPADTNGVMVQNINPSSPAYRKGLVQGSIIVSIDRQPVLDVGQYVELMTAAKENWDNDGTSVLIRYMAYSDTTGWVRQFMAIPFE